MRYCIALLMTLAVALSGSRAVALEGAKPGSAAALQGSSLEKRVKLQFTDVDLARVYESLSKLTGMQFQLESGHRARATVALSDMPVRQALSTLQVMYRLEYAQEGERVLVRRAARRR